MSAAALESTINAAFDARDGISGATKGEVRDAVDHALDLLDKGEARVAERETSGKWKVNQWLKKAVLLSFRITDNAPLEAGDLRFFDKVPLKYAGWGHAQAVSCRGPALALSTELRSVGDRWRKVLSVCRRL